MPMNFPDLESLKHHAKIYRFRDINAGETEDHYRNSLADCVESIDFVESMEIRNKVGWDQWTDQQNTDMLIRRLAKGR